MVRVLGVHESPNPDVIQGGSDRKANCRVFPGAKAEASCRGFVNSALLMELHSIVSGTTASSFWTACWVGYLQMWVECREFSRAVLVFTTAAAR